MNESGGIIRFLGYKIASFEYNCEPSFAQDQIPNGSFRYTLANGFAELGDGVVQVNVLLHTFFNNSDDYENAPLRIKVEIAGKFAMADSTAWQEKWLPNAIAILYPYVRALVGSMTSQSGTVAITLPTINTSTILKQN